MSFDQESFTREDRSIAFHDAKETYAQYAQANQPAGPYDQRKEEYFDSLLATAADDQDRRAVESDVINRAVGNYREHIDAQNVGNIHEARNLQYDGVKLDEQTAREQLAAERSSGTQPDFDQQDFEQTFDLGPGALTGLQISQANDAYEAVGNLAESLANDATPAEVGSVIGQWMQDEQTRPHAIELSKRINAELDRWASPKFGNSGNRTPAQSAAAAQVLSHALRQSVGAERRQVRGSEIEACLRRARLVLDTGFDPAKRMNRPSPPSASVPRYRSIHAAYQQNPT